jgi:cation:H+ antiporter
MEVLLVVLLIAASSWLLGKSADWLTDGAAGLAAIWGVSPLAIGLTVVAFGTSLPELAASLIGGDTIAMGNVLGSNMINLGLVLAVTVLVRAVLIEARFVRFEVMLMVAIGPVVWLLAGVGGVLSRFDGMLLLAGLVAFTMNSFARGRRHEFPALEEETEELPESAKLGAARLLVLTCAGLVGVSVGAKGLVDGAVAGARMLGVSERVIALTIVAAGTSLPELASGIAAVLKNHGALAIGNILGSNIFNLLGILGIVALVQPIGISRETLLVDFPAVVLMQVVCIPLLLRRNRVGRREGVALLGLYAVYAAIVFGFGR